VDAEMMGTLRFAHPTGLETIDVKEP